MMLRRKEMGSKTFTGFGSTNVLMANLRITMILFPSFTISTTLSIKKTFKNPTSSNLATPSRGRRLILKDFKRGTIFKPGT